MSSPSLSRRGLRSVGLSLFQVSLWQLAILVAFVAIAIVDIQGHGRREPALIALAAIGYAGFAALCWLVWHGLRRFQPRLGTVPLAALYVVLMGTLFLGAVIIYLVIEYGYLTGAFSWFSRTFSPLF